MKAIKMIAHILVIVGALNWGLVGLFEFDLVATLFGDMSMVSKLVYSLVGISAVLMLVTRCGCKGKCNS
jgi:uncharacterized membrane protein YuzA (DUF378 family)